MKYTNVILLAVILLPACRAEVPIKTEHGWKTHRVIATRYRNDAIGQSIGFSFPMNPSDGDRSEVSDLINGFGGGIFQGGGYPGAEAMASFSGVADAKSADTKILSIIPVLTQLMDSINDASVVKRILAAHPKPPYKCTEGESLGTECGSRCFALICRHNKAEIDEVATRKSEEYMEEIEKDRSALVWAMRTRILSDAEMTRVREGGTQILVPMCNGMCSSQPEPELQKELNDLLFQQTRLRALLSKEPR